MLKKIKTLLRGRHRGYLNVKNGLYVFFGNGKYIKIRDSYVTDKRILKTAEILAG